MSKEYFSRYDSVDCFFLEFFLEFFLDFFLWNFFELEFLCMSGFEGVQVLHGKEKFDLITGKQQKSIT